MYHDNRDGFADILIGAVSSSSSTGKVYLIYGSTNLATTNLDSLGGSGITITGAGINYNTGTSVSIVGDVNGDGFADILIGADGYSSGAGIAYLIYGSRNLTDINLANPLGSSGIIITSAGADYSAGRSVSSAGDVNKDGYADMLIGAPTHSSSTGIAYLIFGGTNLANINLASPGSNVITITGAGTGYGAGYSVSSAGDVNNDGYADMLIGSPGYSSNTGRVYLIFGGINLANINLASPGSNVITFTVTTSGDQAGFSVRGAGDVNKDGYADMIIGAPYSSSNTGRAYLIYGAASGFITPSPTMLPTISQAPTVKPSSQPSSQPTKQPIRKPSSQPSGQPTEQPTEQPTHNPSSQPSGQPTGQPSVQPSEQPTR